MSNILIVDDNPVNQRLLNHRLGAIGHKILIANHGVEAWQILNESKNLPIHLIFLDIAMPEMDGLTLLRKLRADSNFRSLPVVMLTASGQDADRQAAEFEGANAFLTKPVSSWELAEVVQRLLPTN